MRRDGPLAQGWHTTSINGVKLSYEVAGSGPVCVVHSGGPGISSGYLRMPLLAGYLTMVYLDPIGTGESDLLPGGEYDMATYASYLEAFVNHLMVPQPLILGHSHGGMVALELAMQNPGRLGGVIAYDAAPVYNDELWDEAFRQMAAFAQRWPERPEAIKAARAWHATGGGEPHADDKFLADVFPAYFADYRQTLAQSSLPRLQMTWDPNRKSKPWSARGRLGAITAPTLLICGDFDFVCPPRWSREMRAAIGGSQLRELHNSGHFGHLEQPWDFTDAVVKFVWGP
ncbi:alpha/beta fold hydrolase [Mycobacterium montefiorense]|uniref:alpha/beta fold hydrolase n=1 Tax=Mycobacterium montefiorense TaxID=154654 RepID=UPI0021DDB227|nr:alpha/beta hydrolase [Mycobacterium montefiorense]MCV7426967.1 alpha/beta hydrolase [Mycobacterium montefiorense]GLE52202.1 hydrolase [Mycobacterium montefiorense]